MRVTHGPAPRNPGNVTDSNFSCLRLGAVCLSDFVCVMSSGTAQPPVLEVGSSQIQAGMDWAQA